MKIVLEDSDVVLPNLKLNNPVKIEIVIDDEDVMLTVGPRNWFFVKLDNCWILDGKGISLIQ